MVAISTLKKKAKDGSLEVEDLLEAAKFPSGELAETLESLASKYNWSSTNQLGDGTRVVPLATWSEVVCCYVRGGFEALVTLAPRPDYSSFVIALLTELKTNEAIAALLKLFHQRIDQPTRDPEIAWRLVTAFNLMLSFKDAVPVTVFQEQVIRRFLYTTYQMATTEAERAGAILALRGVGDPESLVFVQAAADFSDHWATTKPTTVAAIKKRLKSIGR